MTCEDIIRFRDKWGSEGSKVMTRFILTALVAAVTFGVPASVAAAPVPYSTGAVVFTNLGAMPGDTLTLGAATGTFNGTGTYTLNNVSFLGTLFTPPPPITGVFTDTLTTSAGTASYGVNYSLVFGVSDTITLGGNSLSALGFNFFINPLVLTSGVGQTSTGALTALVTPIAAVPEPATWAMMIIGFGAAGAGLRVRRHRRDLTLKTE